MRRLPAVLLAGLLAFPRLGLAADIVTFGGAVQRFKAGDGRQAIEDLRALAALDDARAQYLLGLASIEGKLIPRDIPQGIAWLQVASARYVGQHALSGADDAQRALEEVLPQASGADMLKADRITAEFIASREKARQLALAEAEKTLLASLRASASMTTRDVRLPGPVPGCALVPSLTSCSTDEMPRDPAVRCQGNPPKHDEEAKPLTPLGARVHAMYVRTLKDQLWEGRIDVAVHVDRSGYVCQVLIVRGSGLEDLDQAILLAAQRTRFSPARLEGATVESVTLREIEIRYGDLALD